MRHFVGGFVWLYVRYLREVNDELPLVPLVFHPGCHSVHVLPPVWLRRADLPHNGIRRLCQNTEMAIKEAYRALEQPA